MEKTKQDEVCDKINELCHEYYSMEQQQDGVMNKQKCKALCDEIQEMCIACGLASIQQILPMFVGVHPENRGGNMIDIPDFQKLVKDISSIGYSDSEVGPARCFEKASGKEGEYQEKKKRRTVAMCWWIHPQDRLRSHAVCQHDLWQHEHCAQVIEGRGSSEVVGSRIGRRQRQCRCG